MIDRILTAWYQTVLSANAGTPEHGNIHGFTGLERISTFMSAREWQVGEEHPSIFIRLAPLTVPAKGGRREVIFKYVGERIFSPNIMFRFQEPQERSWDIDSRPALYKLIVSLRSFSNSFWGEAEQGGDVPNRDIYTVSPEALYDSVPVQESMVSALGAQNLIKVIDHTLRKVFVGIQESDLIPIEWEGGRVDVNVRLFYNLSFPSSIDKARNNVLGSHIWFWGFIR